MTRYLFLGPSLPDARDLIAAGDFALHRPISAGDLLRLPLAAGDAVGIVDGFFHQTRAIQHKEILSAMADGVRVVGASSIGALRAAELADFGMQGVGEIYRHYRDGLLEADDEVALVHGPEESGYRAASEPLVNIRATLDLAERRGLVTAAVRRAVIDALAHMPYAHRSYRTAVEAARGAGLAEPAAGELDRFCREHPVNRKREDALLLVEAMRAAPDRDERPPLRFNRTVFLLTERLNATGRDTGDGAGWTADLTVLRTCQLLARDYPDTHRRLVLGAIARECAEQCGPRPGGVADPADGAGAADLVDVAIAHGVHRGFYPEPGAGADFGFLARWLTGQERKNLALPEQVAIFLVRSYRLAPGVMDDEGAIDAVRAAPAFRRARGLIKAARDVNGQARGLLAQFRTKGLREDQITAWICAHWGIGGDELELRALDRGLASAAVAIAAARPVYLLAKYNPALVNLRMERSATR